MVGNRLVALARYPHLIDRNWVGLFKRTCVLLTPMDHGAKFSARHDAGK